MAWHHSYSETVVKCCVSWFKVGQLGKAIGNHVSLLLAWKCPLICNLEGEGHCVLLCHYSCAEPNHSLLVQRQGVGNGIWNHISLLSAWKCPQLFTHCQFCRCVWSYVDTVGRFVFSAQSHYFYLLVVDKLDRELTNFSFTLIKRCGMFVMSVFK